MSRRQRRAFAPGTRANHSSHLRIFLSFVVFFGLKAFPTPVETLLLFLEFLARHYQSPKAVKNVLVSLRFQHERLGFSFAEFQNLRCRLALRSLAFTMRSHVSQAAPFPRRLLGPLVGAADALGPWALVFKSLVTIAFVTFARLSSLVPPSGAGFDPSRWPTLADLQILDGWALLRIKYSKTRQAVDGGCLVPFRASGVFPCPVALATDLQLGSGRHAAPLSAPLFACRSRGGAYSLLTQSQARGLLRTCLVAIGLGASDFTFHSFCRGGCSHAFSLGAAESDLAIHGDWRSDAVRQYYPASLARGRVASALATPL